MVQINSNPSSASGSKRGGGGGGVSSNGNSGGRHGSGGSKEGNGSGDPETIEIAGGGPDAGPAEEKDTDGPTLENSNGLIIRMGTTYDVLDENGRWYGGDVVKMDIDYRRVYVQFINFESNFDTYIYDIDNRIAPYRTHTFYPGGPVREKQAVYCMDPHDKWLFAYVLSVDGSEIKVHYKGYVAAYDEFVTIDRIRPLPIVTRQQSSANGFSGKRLFKNPGSMHASGAKYSRNNDNTSKNTMGESNYNSDDIRHNNDSENTHPNHGGYNSNSGNNRMDGSSSPTSVEDDGRKRWLQQDTTPYERYVQTLAEHRLSIVRVDGDGNCLFRSISHQVYGDDRFHNIVRQSCMDYMEADAAFFSQFIEGGMETFPLYIEYKRRDACWGDDPEIQAMCEIYGRPAEIWAYDSVQGARRLRTFHEGGTTRYVTPMRVSYYGGGHYDSIFSDGGDTQRSYTREQVGNLEQLALQRVRSAGSRIRDGGGAAAGGGGGGGSMAMSSSSLNSGINSLKPGYNEEEAINIAIRLSRQAWSETNYDDLDSAFKASSECKDDSDFGSKPNASSASGGSGGGNIRGPSTVEDNIVRDVERRSEEDYANDAILQQAIALSKTQSGQSGMEVLMSEEEQMRLAIEQSMTALPSSSSGGLGGEAMMSEEEMIRQATELSKHDVPYNANLDFSALLGIEPPAYLVDDLFAQCQSLGMYFSRSECTDALRSAQLDPDNAFNLLLDKNQRPIS